MGRKVLGGVGIEIIFKRFRSPVEIYSFVCISVDFADDSDVLFCI